MTAGGWGARGGGVARAPPARGPIGGAAGERRAGEQPMVVSPDMGLFVGEYRGQLRRAQQIDRAAGQHDRARATRQAVGGGLLLVEDYGFEGGLAAPAQPDQSPLTPA